MNATAKARVVPFARPVISPAERNRASAAWLRAQLENLATEIAYGQRDITPDQHRRILTGIARGEDWQDGGWR